ncbi:hypothetical protein BJ912DRAFT_1112617 [Pholiota molesta]|nr:hypothetical protein BJ912DRAFT_1112617 [Pholiota molesta]
MCLRSRTHGSHGGDSSTSALLAVQRCFSSTALYHSADNEGTLADLISQYGSSSALAWLDTEKYKVWRPSQPIPSQNLRLCKVNANRIFHLRMGQPSRLLPSALEKPPCFIAFVIQPSTPSMVLRRPGPRSCPFKRCPWLVHYVMHIRRRYDPEHAIDVAGHNSTYKAICTREQGHVEVREVKRGEWDPVRAKPWRRDSAMERPQARVRLCSTLVQPWLDEEHRRYWLAVRNGKNSPAGIVEKLITTALRDLYANRGRSKGDPSYLVLHQEQVRQQASDAPSPLAEQRKDEYQYHSESAQQTSLPWAQHWGLEGQCAESDIQSGFRCGWTLKTTQFREQFDPNHKPMFICYPNNRFGFLSVGPLLMALRK